MYGFCMGFEDIERDALSWIRLQRFWLAAVLPWFYFTIFVRMVDFSSSSRDGGNYNENALT